MKLQLPFFSKWITLFVMCAFCISLHAQKKVYEISVEYSIKAASEGGNNMLEGATQNLYIKNHLSRKELKTSFSLFVTIKDNKAGTAVQLQETGAYKVLIRLTNENLKEKNKKFEGVSFEKTDETKTIQGYTCNKAIGKLKDGNTFTVYYTKDLVPQNKDYDAQFTGLEGLPLEYEAEIGGKKITFSAIKVSTDPITSSKFELPSKLPGYTEMSYEESKKL